MSLTQSTSLSGQYLLSVQAFAANPAYSWLSPTPPPPPADPMGELLGVATPAISRWNLIPDVIIQANDREMTYDPGSGRYQLELSEKPAQVILKASHPEFLPITQQYLLSDPNQHSLVLFLARPGELQLNKNGLMYPYPDPRERQKPRSEFPDGSLNGNEIKVRGCVIGHFDFSVPNQLTAFTKKHGLPPAYIAQSKVWFMVTPPAGQENPESYYKIIKELGEQPWVQQCGPLLDANNDGYEYVRPSIYVEIESNSNTKLTLDTLLSHPRILSSKQDRNRPGYLLETDPTLGLDIIQLAQALSEAHPLRFAEVQTVELIMSDLREN